ncbi:YhcG family protein [Chitinophaga sp. RCC_12]|uniref:PDDEXK nuclease domain-containing protein n=1 Tax=Chitinophaga sp. RCC_12 TaxID=3239226 RepID=UPI003523C6E0
MLSKQFLEIIQLIRNSRIAAIRSVNTELINLYWNIGEYISKKVKCAEWGQSVVSELAEYIRHNEPELKGFSDKNLWRMKQFYEAYESSPDLIPLLKEVTWTNNLTIFSRTKSQDERKFYLKLCIREKYSTRELDRQINSSIFERTVLGNSKLSAVLREIHPNITNTFKDSYIFDFLNLHESFSENDLQKALIRQMKNFILELGKDFLFVGEEYKIQVGNYDFYIDLLFYHRALQCLVAIELKADRFKPEHMGQINLYLEALDRDVKNDNENPSIGILLCKDKDKEVVEYTLSRCMSPTLIAEYQTKLPDKKILQKKLHEIFGDDRKS